MRAAALVVLLVAGCTSGPGAAPSSTPSPEAIPQLKELNKMDPQKLEDLFLPMQDRITSQRSAMAALTPSSCTATAVERFNEGIDQYDDIREDVPGLAGLGRQEPSVPGRSSGTRSKEFEAALAELEATCAD